MSGNRGMKTAGLCPLAPAGRAGAPLPAVRCRAMVGGLPSAATHLLQALVCLCGWLSLAAVGCSRSSSKETPHESQRPLPGNLASAAGETLRPEPRRLYQLDTSAYTATLAADDEDDSLYVLTSHAA